MGFILGEKPPGCFLCDGPAADDDEAHLILERGERAFVVLNRYPYNNGHLMVSPYRHTGDLTTLDAEEGAEIMRLTQGWVGRLQRAMRPAGFNLGFNLGLAAGAGVADHLHMHVVPRWEGDTNFMTIVGDQRVVNQSLAECWRLLREAR